MYNPLLIMLALSIASISVITWQHSVRANLQQPRRHWLQAALLLSAGLLLEGEAFGVSLLAMALGNALINAGICLQLLVLARLVDVKLPWWLVPLVAVYSGLNKWIPDPLWRLAAQGVEIPLLYLAASVLFQRVERQITGTRYSASALLFLLGALMFAWRDGRDWLYLWLGQPLLPDLDNLVHQVALTFSCAAQLCGSVGFLHIVMQHQHNRLQDAANVDPLTRLGNRRALQYWLRTLDPQTTRVSIVMLDIDHFKAINDNYGHLVGDQVLQALAALLQQHLRDPDQLIRYGGEEFCLLLPDTSLDIGVAVAERLRQRFCQQALLAEQPQLCCSFSAGVAEWQCQQQDFASAQQVADQALYQAKQQGRNRVCRR